MRDGVRLATDIWIPGESQRHPALLIRTAVDKDQPAFWGSELLPNSMAILDAGYVLVWQDSRGTGRSEGLWRTMGLDANDGEDIVGWIVKQPWSNGMVGGFGPSHMGLAQWGIASTGNPNYRCIVPAVAPWDYYRHMSCSEGGALQLRGPFKTAAMWGAATARREGAKGNVDRKKLNVLAATVRNLSAASNHLPLSDHPEFDPWASWWAEILAHPSRDAYWQELSFSGKVEAMTVPALNIGGWFDPCLSSTLDSYEAMRNAAGSADARAGQRLIIGPWDHISYIGAYPGRNFGSAANAANIDLTAEYLRFYDRWLRGNEQALEERAPVKIFVMGIDRWREEEQWPLPDTAYTDYFLSGGGAANTAAGDGVLSLEPAAQYSEDIYRYDPRRPVPTLGGSTTQTPMNGKTGPVDQRDIEARDDVLCYTTPALTDPVEVTGWLRLHLYFSSSTLDTDITAKLVDVYPDGRALWLAEGILRARYRNSLTESELLRPGEVYELTFRLGATSNVFKVGHRMRMEVASSNYPRYTRNTNSGGTLAEETEADMVVAVNRVHHGPDHRSRLTLPLIRRESSPGRIAR
jgi:putative CocE/NonD family hydrolase